MQKIKVRAWDSEQGIMVYDGDRWSPPDRKKGSSNVQVTNHGILYTVTHGGGDWVEVHSGKTSESYYKDWDYHALWNPESLFLNLFTNLKDRNGKEIYQGDILKVISTQPAEWLEVSEWDEIVSGWKPFCMGFGKEVEVIGNIYQNSELLK